MNEKEQTPEEFIKERVFEGCNDCEWECKPACKDSLHETYRVVNEDEALEAVALAKKQAYEEGVEDGHREFFADYPKMKKALEKQAKQIVDWIEKKEKEIKSDERMGYAPALVQVNAPLALIQTEMEGQLNSLRILKIEIKSRFVKEAKEK